MAITNNGLESFHQMIKSQLKRNTPSFVGFVSVLSRVEAMKKQQYEEDRIKGDPQYNRWWPATAIFRELYAKRLDDQIELNEDNKIDNEQTPTINESNEIIPSSNDPYFDKWDSEVNSYFTMFCDLTNLKETNTFNNNLDTELRKKKLLHPSQKSNFPSIWKMKVQVQSYSRK